MESTIKFKEYISEVSLKELKLIYSSDNEVLVLKFKEVFQYKGQIKIKKIPLGGSSNPKGEIEYSTKGILIHELFHLLQFKAMQKEESLKYIILKDNLTNLLDYMLQPKELNKQAISIAFSLDSFGMEYSSKNLNTDLGTQIGRLNYVLNAINSKPKKNY